MKSRYEDFEYNPEEELERFKEYSEIFKPLIIDTTSYIHKSYNNNKKILVEGANAVMLDIDFGTYPYVTSSSPSIGGVFTGIGINHKMLGNVYGVVKAYTTRVGEGPFPTELFV